MPCRELDPSRDLLHGPIKAVAIVQRDYADHEVEDGDGGRLTLDRREGSERDEAALENLCQRIGADLEIRRNLDTEDVQELVQDLSR